MGTIFICQKPKPGPSGVTYDVGPATEYGAVKFIFDAYENPSTNPEASINKVRKALENFDVDTDYCVAAGGDPYGLLLMGFVVNELQLPIKWLRFERLRTRPAPGETSSSRSTSGYYIPVEMPTNGYIDA